MKDVPTTEEELERKATETLVETLDALNRGIMSPDCGRASLRALWGAVSGLVSKELMDSISDAIDAVELIEMPPRRRVFKKMTGIVVMDLPSEDRIGVNMSVFQSNGKIERKIIANAEEHTLIEARERADKVAHQIEQLGYEEVTWVS